MSTRRKFIRNSGALLFGSMAFRDSNVAILFQNNLVRPIGLQLYTLFNVMDNDVPGNIKKIADLGYKEIESAFSRKGGFYGMKAKEFSSLLKDNGLSWKSHHVLGAPFKLPPGAKPPTGADGKPISIPPMRNLKENYQELVSEIAEAGVPYLVCANTPIGNMEEVKSSIEVLNKSGEAAKKAGITLAFHNHDREFVAVDGQVPYDLFLSQLSADTLKMELDLAWVTKAGVDPVELFKKHPGRFPLWHVKDIDKENKIQPVGSGLIDFKRIFDNADAAGLKHFFVEHDMPADPFASITSSYKYLNKLMQG